MCTLSPFACGYTLLMALGVVFSALALFYPAVIIINKASPTFDSCNSQGSYSNDCKKAYQILSSDIIPFSCSMASTYNLIDHDDISKYDSECRNYMDSVDETIKKIWYTSAIGVGISVLGFIVGVIVIVAFSCCGCLRIVPLLIMEIFSLALTAVMIVFAICYHDKWDYLRDQTTTLIPELQGTSLFLNTFWFGIAAVIAGGISSILVLIDIVKTLCCCRSK
uniref:Transmembrane protein n=1 Tax=Parastrongyloides trichosuri TaxID=131310 RepID=A0A0N4Z1G7_PARTI